MTVAASSINISTHANGLLKKRSGTATPTTEYVYDSFGGQLTTLKTLYGSTSQTANTPWIYDSYRGWLSGKGTTTTVAPTMKTPPPADCPNAPGTGVIT